MNEQITVIGNVATEPHLRHTSAGIPVTSFRLAVSSRRFHRERNEWVEADTNWYQISAFRNLATHSQLSFQKGDRVIISGKLKIKEWETASKRGTSVEIDADALGHDLLWGTSNFSRASRDGVDRRIDPAVGSESDQAWSEAETAEHGQVTTSELLETPF